MTLFAPENTILICPENDLESQTILGIAEKLGFEVRPSRQRWGAKLEKEPDGAFNNPDKKDFWTEPMVWSLALEGKEDLERFKELGWGLRTWDLWNWNDCLPRKTHVNDSESYFTGATNVSVMTGPPASPEGEADGGQARSHPGSNDRTHPLLFFRSE